LYLIKSSCAKICQNNLPDGFVPEFGDPASGEEGWGVQVGQDMLRNLRRQQAHKVSIQEV